jgi:hypothetical protein
MMVPGTKLRNVFFVTIIWLASLFVWLNAAGDLRATQFRADGTAPLEILADPGRTNFPQVPIAAHQLPAQPNAPLVDPITPTVAYTTYLPIVAKTELQLYGSVTFHSVPVSNVAITLFRCCIFVHPVGWIQIQVTTTNANGVYNFTGVPGMSAAEGSTYIAYYNNVGGDPARVSSWATHAITSYMTDTTVYLGSFDLANVPLLAPSDNAVVSLPTTFRWVPRSEFPSDNYALAINVFPGTWYSNRLPYSGSYVLNENPVGWGSYEWHIEIFAPDGGVGTSFEQRGVIFSP